MTEPDKRTLTAYHEAGHSAVACYLGYRVMRVTIDGDQPGCLVRYPLGHGEDRCIILVCIAGPTAEAILYRPSIDLHAFSRDMQRAEKLAKRIARRGDCSRREVVNEATTEILQLLRRPDIWAAVESIAAQLLQRGTMNGDDVRILCRNIERVENNAA